MSSHADFLALKRFGSLDGLRALSIVAVIWHHTAPSWVSGTWSHVGADGVTLFFAISGFLITTLLLRERERHGRIDLKAFYWRRALRIFPLYYTVLLLYVVLVWVMERHSPAGQAFFNNLPYFLTYTSNLFVQLDDRTIFYFAWSLAAEEQFYLLWPPVLVLCVTSGRAGAVLLAVVVAGVLGQLGGQKFLSAVPLAIVYGALMALVMHHRSGYDAVHRVLGFRAAPLVVLVLVLLAAALGWGQLPAFVTHALFAALVLACVVREDHLLQGLMQLRWVGYIGMISYGMYMLHMLCKNVSTKLLKAAGLPTDTLLVFGLTMALSVVAAGLSFRYYESIFLRLKRVHER
jgi:peptidoglycan/LPS O-acetylase OafA/YrhL